MIFLSVISSLHLLEDRFALFNLSSNPERLRLHTINVQQSSLEIGYWQRISPFALVTCASNLGHPDPQTMILGNFGSSRLVFISLIYPLTVRVAGAPQIISQPVSSIFPRSPLSSATWRTVHSLILSSHLFLCLPGLLPPFTVPCKMGLDRPDKRET